MALKCLDTEKENKTKFVFSMHSEGFTYVDLKFYSDCFEYMKGFDGYEFAHAYGAHPHLLNKQYLRKHYANLKLCEGIKILLINHFELMMQGYLLGDRKQRKNDVFQTTWNSSLGISRW